MLAVVPYATPEGRSPSRTEVLDIATLTTKHRSLRANREDRGS
jgi:hypothetical protein